MKNTIFFLLLFIVLVLVRSDLRNLQSTYALAACAGKTQNTPCQFRGLSPTAPTSYGQCRANTVGVMTCNTAYLPTSNNDPTSPEDNSNTTLFNVASQTSGAAQLSNIAFNGLSFIIENDFCSNSFLPPLHYADFFGFQHLRDITPNGQGHNTMFLTNVAANVLNLLDSATVGQLVALAKTQAPSVQQWGSNRYKLISAFTRLLKGSIPVGTKGLNSAYVQAYSANLYQLEAPIALARAQLFTNVINSLNSSQIATLKKYQSTSYIQSWPKNNPRTCYVSGLSNIECTLLNAFAGGIYSWFTGNIETDTYFGPERQFNYFGGLYVKDVMSVGAANYTIPEEVGGTLSRSFLAALNTVQQQLIIGLVNQQSNNLTALVSARRNISLILRTILTGINKATDSNVIDSIAALETTYGKLDGYISSMYATNFATVYKSLNSTQISQMKAMKDLSGFPCQKTSGYTYMFQWPYNSTYFDSTPVIDTSSDEFFI